jgi:acetylornithine/succinyldiaminopimelate/putrescine aminotransferase
MGNGFPVSGVVLRKDIPVQPAMLPGSTYAGNPLSAAAIVGTLETMATMDMEAATDRIGRAVQGRLGDITGEGFSLRGAGALWVYHFAQPAQAQAVAQAAYERGVFLSQAGPLVRLLPAATIEEQHLHEALEVVAEEVERQARQQPSAATG